MLLYRSDGLVYECIKKQERFNTHNGYSWYYKANFHVAKLWIQVFRETIETCLTTFSLGCGEMTPFFPVTGLQTCQTGFATPKAKHENKQILSVSLWSGSSHLLLGQKCSIMSKWKFSKKDDLAHHKGNLNLHIVLFRLYFVVIFVQSGLWQQWILGFSFCNTWPVVMGLLGLTVPSHAQI